MDFIKEYSSLDVKTENTNDVNIFNKKPIISVKDMSFSYPNKEIFRNLNFDIYPGDRIAVVGENGVGKTTLIKLLLGILNPVEGCISIDRTANSKDFANIAACFQTSPLLPFTVVENISCTPEKETIRQKIISIARKVGIEKIVYKENGESPNCTSDYYKDGTNFSGGECQKIFMARMMYKDVGILLLDEPTASLDAVSEKNIYELYNDLSDKKTCVFVSHRLNTTNFCNKVLFIEDKDKVYLSDFDTLYSNNAKFHEMYDLQKNKYSYAQ